MARQASKNAKATTTTTSTKRKASSKKAVPVKETTTASVPVTAPATESTNEVTTSGPTLNDEFSSVINELMTLRSSLKHLLF